MLLLVGDCSLYLLHSLEHIVFPPHGGVHSILDQGLSSGRVGIISIICAPTTANIWVNEIEYLQSFLGLYGGVSGPLTRVFLGGRTQQGAASVIVSTPLVAMKLFLRRRSLLAEHEDHNYHTEYVLRQIDVDLLIEVDHETVGLSGVYKRLELYEGEVDGPCDEEHHEEGEG